MKIVNIKEPIIFVALKRISKVLINDVWCTSFGTGVDKKTPRQKIEDWIINNKTLVEFSWEVNENLILYNICLFKL